MGREEGACPTYKKYMTCHAFVAVPLQTTTLQKSLQAIESNSKQQQELSNRTMRELKEHLDRVMQENTQKEQLLLALKKERDRLSRENQTKVSKCKS